MPEGESNGVEFGLGRGLDNNKYYPAVDAMRSEFISRVNISHPKGKERPSRVSMAITPIWSIIGG